MAAMAFHLRVRFHFPVGRASTGPVANGSGARLYLASIPPRKYPFNYSARCCVSHLCIRRKELCRGEREAKLFVPQRLSGPKKGSTPGYFVCGKDRYACRYLVGRQLKQRRTLNNRFLFFPAGNVPLRNTF